MRITTLLSITAIALTAAIGSVSAAGQFATLDGVTAVPMSSGELDAVAGQHIHFRILAPSGNISLATGQPPVGHKFHCGPSDGCNVPSYNGLIGAAVNSPNLCIPGGAGTPGAGC